VARQLELTPGHVAVVLHRAKKDLKAGNGADDHKQEE